jgi:hypothetical protein
MGAIPAHSFRPQRVGHAVSRTWLALLVLLVLCLGAQQAQAHTLSVGYVDLVVPRDDGPVDIEVDLSIRDLALSLPLDANQDARVTWGEVLAIRDDLERLLESGLVLSDRDGACRMRPAGLGLRRYDDGSYVAVRLEAHCASHAGLTLRYAVFATEDPAHRAMLTFAAGDRRGTQVIANAAAPVSLGTASSARYSFVSYLREGVHHILIGYDHLAFLLSLLLPAALSRVHGRWVPVEGFAKPMKRVVGVVTSFTVAHSMTLSLAALGWVRPAAQWVEACIAASVLLVALNNLRPVLTGRVWVLAFGFGLIHGFGFAGALAELGLQDRQRLLPLLGFNLGVEAGQLLVVAVALPLIFVLSRRAGYARWMMPACSIAIALLAAWWLVVRLWG